MTAVLTARRTLTVGEACLDIACLRTALEPLGGPERFPASIAILLEMLVRGSGHTLPQAALAALRDWPKPGPLQVPFLPARVLLQDYTGTPVLTDLAALRDEAAERGLPRDTFGFAVPSDLVIDHSLSVDVSARADALQANAAIEMDRNHERFTFLKWSERAFPGLRLFPPGSGICHQINMEQLASVVATSPPDSVSGGRRVARPDSVLGADSHTTMIGGLGVLGWGVGGLEALSAVLGNPVTMALPEVLGVRLIGRLASPATATDLVLSLVHRLRQVGVVGRFVEFFGPGLAGLPAAHRATIANMAPEAGATCLFFPVDEETLRYLILTGRSREHVALVEAYCRAQGLWRGAGSDAEPRFSATIEFDLSSVGPSLAGPGRPDQHLTLPEAARVSRALGGPVSDGPIAGKPERAGLHPGDVVLAAITSCTNTANAHSVITAGLLARNAVRIGLMVKPWIKTSFAPGSRAVRDYLDRSGLQASLDTLGFGIVGFGCTTCIGNAGPLHPDVTAALAAAKVQVSAVLSGNRNFANRVHSSIPANFLASPALVVAYALAGSMTIDLATEPVGVGRDGHPVHLAELWPGADEVEAALADAVGPDAFRSAQHEREGWGDIDPPADASPWMLDPVTIQRPPISAVQRGPMRDRLAGLRILGMFGDDVTTDHISPAFAIRPGTLAGAYLMEQGVSPGRLHSFGARRGNWKTMLLGAFTNPALRNELLPDGQAGMTRHWPGGETLPIQRAADRYNTEGVGLVLVAGRNYGTGSSRDDAAKSTRYLGVVAVIAESFERIHRSNLLAMGVLPLVFPAGMTRHSLGWTGAEVLELDLRRVGAAAHVVPCRVDGQDGPLLSARIDTEEELAFWQAGGLMPYLIDRAVAAVTR